MALPHSSSSSHCCLAHRIRLLDRTPSLQPFVGDFLATTRCSAPESAPPYSRPRGSATCDFSVCIAVSGSHVPLNRLFGKLRPPLMPDATPPVNRFRRSLSRVNDSSTVLDIVPTLSTLCNAPR